MSDPSGSIGRNIRTRRQGLRLSLDALASASGVSSTMLSEVERGRKNPTVKLAYQIARALGCTLTDLLDERPPSSVTLVRASQRRTLVDPQSGVERHALASSLLDHRLEFVWYELPAGQSTDEMGANIPGLVELCAVTRGEVEIILGGVVHSLQAGDSISYGPQTTTEYRNPSDTASELLLVIDSSKVRAS